MTFACLRILRNLPGAMAQMPGNRARPVAALELGVGTRLSQPVEAETRQCSARVPRPKCPWATSCGNKGGVGHKMKSNRFRTAPRFEVASYRVVNLRP